MNSLEKWDKYFYDICNVVAGNSKCLSRKIGAVLVKENTIIGTGYNGPPRGILTCDQRFLIDPILAEEAEKHGLDPKECAEKKICPRRLLGYKSGEGLEWCVAGHGERNALINSARMGISTKDCTLYMNCGIPCSDCLVEIINSGVSEIVVVGLDFYDKSSKYLMDNVTTLECRTYAHLGDVVYKY